MSERKNLSPREERIQEERIELAQILLNRPWIRKEEDPQLFFRIRDHYDHLRNWFLEMCGFTLLFTRDLFKLEKIPGKVHSWMGFEEFKDGLDYVFFVFALWYLEEKSELEQFLLKDLIEAIRERLADEDFEFDQTNYTQRLSLKRALKKLRSLGVLSVVDGDEEEWVHHYKDERKTILYECTPLTRYVMRRFTHDITAADEMTSFADGFYPPTREGEVARRKHQIFRRYLQEPLVLDDQWDEEQRYYVLTQRSYIIDQLGTYTGLQGKRYKEGLLFYHPTPKGEMALFPTEKSISDLVLLFGVELRRQQEDQALNSSPVTESGILITRSEMELLVQEMKDNYLDNWSKQDREKKISALVQEMITHMAEWGLAEMQGQQQILLRSGLGRWDAAYKTVETKRGDTV